MAGWLCRLALQRCRLAKWPCDLATRLCDLPPKPATWRNGFVTLHDEPAT
jgi:hypothetical protein